MNEAETDAKNVGEPGETYPRVLQLWPLNHSTFFFRFKLITYSPELIGRLIFLGVSSLTSVMFCETQE